MKKNGIWVLNFDQIYDCFNDLVQLTLIYQTLCYGKINDFRKIMKFGGFA